MGALPNQVLAQSTLTVPAEQQLTHFKDTTFDDVEFSHNQQHQPHAEADIMSRQGPCAKGCACKRL